ncbi:MAG: hypothetical protein WD844_08165 [Thermoleophilaceae bacterium]
MANRLPPLLDDRSAGQELLLVVVVPSLFGAIAGVMLGISEIAYLVLAILGIAGGYGAGLEHAGPRYGAYRGLVGGMQFGVWILLAHGLFFDSEPKAELPHPEILLVAITTVFGVILGALGGRHRARLAERTAAAPAPAQP